MALACERWGCLPKAGGYLDQPAGLINKMSAAMNVYKAFRGFMEAENSAEWLGKNEWAAKIYARVMELRNG